MNSVGRSRSQIESFALRPGQTVGGHYIVTAMLGRGYEGEVYRVRERRTGVTRAAKLFFPHRNEGDRAVRRYARKLERLRDCPLLMKYHHSETINLETGRVTALISEYIEGEILDNLVRRQTGHRLRVFEAMCLLYTLAEGLERVHARREYHGDMHGGNVIVRRRGIFFDAKVVDLYDWGAPSAENRREDVINLIRLFYDSLGGKKTYKSLPGEAKRICCGLKRSLIVERFPTVRHLRMHLECFEWGG